MPSLSQSQAKVTQIGSRIGSIAKWLWETNFSHFLSTALVWIINIGFVISVIYVLSQFSGRASVFFTQLLTLLFLVIGFAFMRFFPDFVRLINSIERHSKPKEGVDSSPEVPMKWSIWYGNVLRILGLTLPVTAPLSVYYLYYRPTNMLSALILIMAVVFGLNAYINKSEIRFFPKEQPKKLIAHIVVSIALFALLFSMWSIMQDWSYGHLIAYLVGEPFSLFAVVGFVCLVSAFVKQVRKSLVMKTSTNIAISAVLGVCVVITAPHILATAVYVASIATGLHSYTSELAGGARGGGVGLTGLALTLFIAGSISALFYILVSDLWRAAPRILSNFMVAFPNRDPDPGAYGRVLIYFRRVLLVGLALAVVIAPYYLRSMDINPYYLVGWPTKVALVVLYIMALSDLLLFLFRWRSLVSGGQAETRISFPALRFFLKACHFINAVGVIVTMIILAVFFEENRMNGWLSLPIGILLYILLTYVTHMVRAVVDIEAHTRRKERAPLDSTRYFGIWLFTMTMKTLAILGTIILLIGIVGFGFALKAGLVGLIVGPVVAGIFYVFFGWLADFGHCLLCLENNVRSGSALGLSSDKQENDQPEVHE